MILQNTQAIVLAAGKSTRFKTKKSKLLFSICGQSMVLYSARLLEECGVPMTFVLGHQADTIRNEIEKAGIKDTSFVVQEEQRGTGHAVACTQHLWQEETLLIVYGDMPLLSQKIIQELAEKHQTSGATVSFCTAHVIDPTGYGRVLASGDAYEIVEEKDCSPEQRQITCVNAGIYLVNKDFLKNHINSLGTSAITGEFYLPDIVRLACQQGLKVCAISVPFDNVRGVNTLQELWSVEQIKRSDLIKYWMSNGVRFELAQSIHIDLDVQIGAGSFIGTGVHLLGKTIIGEECFVGAFTIIEDTMIGDGTTIHSHSVVQHSVIGQQVHVGPFARVRNHVALGDHVEVGNFVELKSTSIGDYSKAKHLNYIGDATIGANVNIGAGAITCNYDGVKKHQTIIENEAFVGSNASLIAPIRIGSGSYTAAGSVLTTDVPSDALAIGRARHINKPEYAHVIREKLQAVDKQVVVDGDSTKEGNDEDFQFKGAVKTDTDHKLGF